MQTAECEKRRRFAVKHEKSALFGNFRAKWKEKVPKNLKNAKVVAYYSIQGFGLIPELCRVESSLHPGRFLVKAAHKAPEYEDIVELFRKNSNAKTKG